MFSLFNGTTTVVVYLIPNNLRKNNNSGSTLSIAGGMKGIIPLLWVLVKK